MITHGKGTNGRRPYRGAFGQERLAAANHDLDRSLKRSEARRREREEALEAFKKWNEQVVLPAFIESTEPTKSCPWCGITVPEDKDCPRPSTYCDHS